jgi:O-antigen ligase
MTHAIAHDPPADRLEQVGLLALFGVGAAVLFSIAIAQILLTVAIVCWVALMVTRRERFEVPAFFWPLVAFGAWTLISAAFSPDPRASLIECKQLVLFLLIPLVYRFATGNRAVTMTTVILSFAAVSAAFGIFQYAILHHDDLGQRAQGTLGHYMTYSGLLMLVLCTALARVLFGKSDRIWAAAVMPALAVAIVVTFTRSATVGACAAAAVLFSLKDFRLLAILPIVTALFFAVAPAKLNARFQSTFDLKNPTNRDRLAMLREGEHMVRDHPLVGVGPNMVLRRYAEYRDPEAVEKVNPHLHNVPMQIAAERGLPALGLWLWFIVALIVALARRVRHGDQRFLAASALAAVTAMLGAGMFEHNFGDSEFLMMFLILITLPFAADRIARSADASRPAPA